MSATNDNNLFISVYLFVDDGGRKLMGIVYFTLTGRPSFWPGFHAGIDETTRMASLSSSGHTDLTTLQLVILPSFSTIKLINATN